VAHAARRIPAHCAHLATAGHVQDVQSASSYCRTSLQVGGGGRGASAAKLGASGTRRNRSGSKPRAPGLATAGQPRQAAAARRWDASTVPVRSASPLHHPTSHHHLALVGQNKHAALDAAPRATRGGRHAPAHPRSTVQTRAARSERRRRVAGGGACAPQQRATPLGQEEPSGLLAPAAHRMARLHAILPGMAALHIHFIPRPYARRAGRRRATLSTWRRLLQPHGGDCSYLLAVAINIHSPDRYRCIFRPIYHDVTIYSLSSTTLCSPRLNSTS